MNYTKYTCVLLMAAVLFVTGCQESESQIVQRARLVGHENIQLKKQLQEKDKEIAELQETMKEMAQEHQQQVQQSSEGTIKALQMMAQTAKELEECRAENERLKKQIQQ